MGIQSNLLIDVSREGERVVLRLDGELDLASVPLLEFIDSTGLRAILLLDKRSTERGATLALVRGSPQVQRLMTMTRVDEHLKIIATPEEILL
jgi:anti-anti-sigma regulatory factor